MNARHGQTSYRDRTQEFIKTIENLKKSSSTPDAPSSNAVSRLEVPKSAASIQSEFSKRASQIGLGIHHTSQKLTNLAKCKYFTILTRNCFRFWSWMWTWDACHQLRISVWYELFRAAIIIRLACMLYTNPSHFEFRFICMCLSVSSSGS